jgi:hypothetical protein
MKLSFKCAALFAVVVALYFLLITTPRAALNAKNRRLPMASTSPSDACWSGFQAAIQNTLGGYSTQRVENCLRSIHSARQFPKFHGLATRARLFHFPLEMQMMAMRI